MEFKEFLAPKLPELYELVKPIQYDPTGVDDRVLNWLQNAYEEWISEPDPDPIDR